MNIETYFRWSLVATFMKLRIAQVASFVPLMGYAILYNDQLKPYLSWTVSDSRFWFETDTRLNLIYFGSLLLLFALIGFGIFCPNPIRRSLHVDDFATVGEQAIPSSEHNKMALEVSKFVLPNANSENTSHLDKRGNLIEGEDRKQKFEFSKATGFFVRQNYDPDEIAAISTRTTRTRNIQRIYYYQLETQYKAALVVEIILIFLGSVMVTLPSVEVAILATKTVVFGG